MQKQWVMLGLACGMAFAAGCRSVRPGATDGAPAAAPSLAEELARLERTLAETRREQVRVERQLYEVRMEIFQSAQNLKKLKDRTDAWEGDLTTNRAVTILLEDRLREMRERAAAGQAEDAEKLRATLERAEQQRVREQAIAREREKEVRDLREALAARDGAVRREKAEKDRPAPPVMPPSVSRGTEPDVAKEAPPPPPPVPAATTSVYRLVADGNAALKQGDLARAHALFTEALGRDGTLLGARIGLAACAYQMDDTRQARRLIGEVLDVDPQSAQALGLRGILNWKDGHLNEAVADCARAVELEPADAMLRKFHGIVLHARKRTADAIVEMRKAVELDPADAEATLNLAILLATSRPPQLDEARGFYESALASGVERDAALDALLYPASAQP